MVQYDFPHLGELIDIGVNMTELEVIKWVVLAVMGLAVWFFKRNLETVDRRMEAINTELQASKTDIQHVKRDYLHRDDFKEFKIELRAMFEEIKRDLKDVKNNHSKDE